jgi:hypothetical protein
MKGMKAAIATIVWGIILGLITYGVVGLLAHYVGFAPLPLYAASVIGFTVAIMSSYCEDEG